MDKLLRFQAMHQFEISLFQFFCRQVDTVKIQIFFKYPIDIAGNMSRDLVQRSRYQARLTVERLTWTNIMGQLESVLVDLVNSQGENHVQTALSPELYSSTD